MTNLYEHLEIELENLNLDLICQLRKLVADKRTDKNTMLEIDRCHTHHLERSIKECRSYLALLQSIYSRLPEEKK